jgi:DnaJ-class molecular chaperone
MGLFGELLSKGLASRAQHFKRCPECNGRGRWVKPLRDPAGNVPWPRVMAKIMCTTCKGEGRVRVYEQWTEKGRTKSSLYYPGA